ncbi:MAG: hypothetical protein Q9225_002925 [Loekoesia sp. 1 TL-2023]
MALRADTDVTDWIQLIRLYFSNDEINVHGLRQLRNYLRDFCDTYDEQKDACHEFFEQMGITDNAELIAANAWEFAHQFARCRKEIPRDLRRWVLNHVARILDMSGQTTDSDFDPVQYRFPQALPKEGSSRRSLLVGPRFSGALAESPKSTALITGQSIEGQLQFKATSTKSTSASASQYRRTLSQLNALITGQSIEGQPQSDGVSLTSSASALQDGFILKGPSVRRHSAAEEPQSIETPTSTIASPSKGKAAERKMDPAFSTSVMRKAMEEFSLDLKILGKFRHDTRLIRGLHFDILDIDPSLWSIAERLQYLEIAFSSLIRFGERSLIAKPEELVSVLDQSLKNYVACYGPIEKVLIALLEFLKIDVDKTRDPEGNHSFHLKVLEAFDKPENPLRFLFQHGSKTPTARDAIDDLRKDRNEFYGAKRERRRCLIRWTRPCDFYDGCMRVMGALYAAFVICWREQRCPTPYTRISDPTNPIFVCGFKYCGLRFSNWQLWRQHWEEVHPEMLNMADGKVLERVVAVFASERRTNVKSAEKALDDNKAKSQQAPESKTMTRSTQTDMVISNTNSKTDGTPSSADTRRESVTPKLFPAIFRQTLLGTITRLWENIADIVLAQRPLGELLMLCLRGKRKPEDSNVSSSSLIES